MEIINFGDKMKLKTFIVITSLVIIISFSINLLKLGGESMEIKKEKAVEIANKEAIKLGCEIKSMDMQVDKYNVPWNLCLPKHSESRYVIEKQSKLANKEYWAVYYFYNPKKTEVIHKGGDICVFIDTKTGEIITTYRGK